ncbi:transposase family protein [Streptomyces guryensis]|uniref:Transposase family protein n=1 Tax=Streptomyces guryensis TaxID=2886947 RepID=A0A9Q3VJR2_9ACTN|nr:transposase family protein [Streptomyces guryensis]MCD9875073.1 transposase family protein [Streptomyces guryensis]
MCEEEQRALRGHRVPCRKHHRHGLHFLALTDDKGWLIRICAARPGRTHDATVARHDHLVEHLEAAGLGALADLGFLGVDKPDAPDDLGIVAGFKATRYRKPTAGQKEANRVPAAGRAPVEHGFTHLKNWRILTKLRSDPARATGLLRVLLVLTNLEVNR